MTGPVLMVVDDNPARLKMLDGALRVRHDHDYLIISVAAPQMALGRLLNYPEASGASGCSSAKASAR